MDEEGIVRVRDAAGTAVMYDAALADLEATTDEALQIGSLFLQRYAGKHVPDRLAVLNDLFQGEAAYHEAVKQVA